jgi:hypothetical protein
MIHSYAKYRFPGALREHCCDKKKLTKLSIRPPNGCCVTVLCGDEVARTRPSKAERDRKKADCIVFASLPSRNACQRSYRFYAIVVELKSGRNANGQEVAQLQEGARDLERLFRLLSNESKPKVHDQYSIKFAPLFLVLRSTIFAEYRNYVLLLGKEPVSAFGKFWPVISVKTEEELYSIAKKKVKGRGFQTLSTRWKPTEN